MNDSRCLPIIVTVSGHRDLRAQDEPALRDAVLGIFTRLRAAYPATELLLLTPLAVGADRLVARVAIELSIPFHVPMPMPEDVYRADFDTAENAEFDELLALAGERYPMPYVLDNTAENVADPDRRARQYALVGAYIAQASHILIALWNGKTSASLGGTAQIVDYRLKGVPEPYYVPAGLLDAPETGPVYHVFTPRQSDPKTEQPAGTLVILARGGRITAGNDPFRALCERVDEFNRDVVAFAPKEVAGPSATARFAALAEHLATHYQRRHHASITQILIATACAAITLAYGGFVGPTFLFAVLYCAFVGLALRLYFRGRGGRWQDRFIEYRAFEIGLTVQRHWDDVGVNASVADEYLRLQRSELDWVRKAIRAVSRLDAGIERNAEPAARIAGVREWIAGQHAFFRHAASRDRVRFEYYDRLTEFFFNAGLGLAGLTVVGAAFALLCWLFQLNGGPAPWFEHYREPIAGTIAGLTILAAITHEYPRRRAFHAQARRYVTMFRLYDRALRLLDDVASASSDEQLRRAQDVAREIGREALSENGDWVLMHRELPLEMVHV